MKLRLSSHARPNRKTAAAGYALALLMVVALLALLDQSGPSRRRSATAFVHGRRMAADADLATQHEAAYRRQRAAAADLVARMRAQPAGWAHNSFHSPTNALWVDPFRDIYRCPAVMEKLGKLSDGGKWVCGVDSFLQRPGCVVYSFGSDGDTSFEEAILNRTACAVFTFDPTLAPGVQARVEAVPGIEFAAVGLGAVDGDAAIGGRTLPVRTLATHMRERGHTWVDLLKIDVEGAEWEVLESLVAGTGGGGPLPVGQAQVEFHVGWGDHGPQEAIDLLEALDDAGMRVFHVEENAVCDTCAGQFEEVAFANVAAGGRMVVGPPADKGGERAM